MKIFSETFWIALSGILRNGFINDAWMYRIWRWLGKARLGKTFWIQVKAQRKLFWLAGEHGKNDALINLKTLINPPLETALALVPNEKNSEFIDVGANIGQSLLLAKGQRNIRIISYEPSEACCKMLRQIICKNAFQNVQLRESALGRKAGNLKLFTESDTDCNASVVPGFRRNTAQIRSVRVSTLDEELRAKIIINPKLIKIDVEGGELDVLTGGLTTIKKHRPILCIETLFTKNPAHKKRQQIMTKVLHRYEYTIFHFQASQGLVPVKTMDGDPDYQNNDYLCFPTESARLYFDNSTKGLN